ncbi:non-receptor tyrosine-protein kinase TYK2-like isoform X3 [Festucalex cinctus]
MPVRRWVKRRTSEQPLVTPQHGGVHVYLFWSPNEECYLSHMVAGQITAEELCISAAEAVGITPLYHMLFALYDPLSCCWYSPNHVFHPEENSSLILHYRMRFFFRNWHGLNDKEPVVTRFTVKSEPTVTSGEVHDWGGDREAVPSVTAPLCETDGTTAALGKPLLEIKSVEYLYAQAKYDFLNELIPMENFSSEEELSRFKTESLGMAMLNLIQLALHTGCTLQHVARKTSFVKCIPKSYAKHISEYNVLTKLRLRWMFQQSVRKHQNDMEARQPDVKEVICKYLCALESLVPRFGTETFAVLSLRLSRDDEDTIQAAWKGDSEAAPVHELMVSAAMGLQWRETTCCEKPNGILNSDYGRKMKRRPSQLSAVAPVEWKAFCDFPDIIHLAISDANVCISTQDNECLEVEMKSSQEARSFISLLDGYYRLTADAHHYLCHEVAPPRVLLSEANGLHGPMHDDFVLHKLKREEAEEQACLVRWSILDYHRLVLAVPSKTQNGSMARHKLFCIQHKDSVFSLDSWQEKFSSVKELISTLKDYILESDTERYTIKKCCRPRQGELSNLLVKRHGVDGGDNARTLSPNKLELCFQIKYKDLILRQHLGFGTRTHIYSAHLNVRQAADEQKDNLNGDEQNVQVVLKVLEQSKEDITSAFFEMASLMRQVSHSHLVFVHGLSVNGSENIMVEEFVEFGPLDIFLRREKAKLTSRWKFIVAKQLACALNYLATKGVTHGNVCGRNVLVARRGLEQGASPLVKLSDPGIAVNILYQEERLERTPWIAPECVYSKAPVGLGADQWSFGVTLLEICNDSHLPISGATMMEKECFYQQKGKLLEPSSQDLAVYINKCLVYEPLERPSFSSLLRDLIDIRRKNPDIFPSNALPHAESTTFLKRHLKRRCILGKGNFGTVTLYMYDPANDGTGELVAVKALKQENGPLPRSWMKEIDTLKSLDHNNIVKYKGCCTEMEQPELPPSRAMAAVVSVSANAKEESTDTTLGFVSRPLHKKYDLAAPADHEKWRPGDGRHPELEAGEEVPTAGREGQRRADEDWTPLSPQEIQSRLERTRREFYNRRKIIVKNLPSDITNQEVHELLGNYDLKYCFVDKYKGTAFVTLLNGEQAQSAIKEFHQHTMRDREISVQLQPTDALLCIANLPRSFTQQQFEELVRPFGNLERCFLVYRASSGHSKGYGFVEYMKKDSAARAKSELLGKQLGSRMLYVHWTEVGSLTYPLLHSKCLCVDRLPQSLLTAQDLRNALADAHTPVFCQLAQGQDGSFRRFAVLEFATAEMAEEAQQLSDGRLLGDTNIRVSFCAPGPPGRSMLAALIAAQTMSVNRGKGLLPDPTAMQILSGLNNPAALQMLLNPLSQGHKQGILGAAPAMPLLANPALPAMLLQLLLQNQAKAQQQAGLLAENPLAPLPVQQGIHLLGDLPQGGVVSGVDPLPPLKPLSRAMARDQESPSFPQTHSPTLQGVSVPLLGSMMGPDGLAAQAVSVLGDPTKSVTSPQSSFLPVSNVFPSGANSRPHPYRKRPTLSNVSNQHLSMHPNYNLRYQDSYNAEYPPLHQDQLQHLYEEQENHHMGDLTGYGQQLSCPSDLSQRHFTFPPSPPPSSYFSSDASANGCLPPSQLNRAVGMPPVSHTSGYPPGLVNTMKTPIGSHKRVFSRLIPSPEPSPEGSYVGQHSQGLGGHYADSYLKRKRIF